MDPITILSALATFAPMLGKWMGASDKVQDIAEKASGIAAVVTGKTNLEEQKEALAADPALRYQFEQALVAQESEFEALYISDKADARKRDIALSASPAGNVRANYLVAFAMFMIVAILAIIIFRDVLDEYVKTTITLIVGMFLNELKNIYSFEFGTTRRSREKTDVLNNLEK